MFGLTLKIALQSLRASRTRTILTTVGIMIGVASILLVFAVGEGARQKLNQNVSGVPASTALLSSSNASSAQASLLDPTPSHTNAVFTERDLASLSDSGLSKTTAPLMEIAARVTHRNVIASDAFTDGTNRNFFTLLNLGFVDGGNFSDGTQNGVVLGNSLAEELFGTELSSGQTLTLHGDTYTVVGVLAQSNLPTSVGQTPVDHTAYIQYGEAKAYTECVAQFSQLLVKTPPASYAKITALIASNHGNEVDFSISQPRLAGGIPSAMLPVISAITSVTAGISLLIGGIGIMNIMLVNVSERTREIGIRKAIGASNGQVLAQFLIESTVMALAGGISGCVLAISLGLVGGLFLPFGIVFTPHAVLIVLGLALGVGILFGLFPAIRAARKDTIEALRYYQ